MPHSASPSPSPPPESPAKRRKTSHHHSSLHGSEVSAPADQEVSHSLNLAQTLTSHPRDMQAAAPQILVPSTPPRLPRMAIPSSDDEDDVDDEDDMVAESQSPQIRRTPMLRPAGSSAPTISGTERTTYDDYGDDENAEDDNEQIHYTSSSSSSSSSWDEDEDEDSENADPEAPARRTTSRKRLPGQSVQSPPHSPDYVMNPSHLQALEAIRAAEEAEAASSAAEADEVDEEEELELHEYAQFASADDEDDDNEGVLPLLSASNGADHAASPRTAHARYGQFLEDTLLKIKAREGIAAMVRAEQEKMRPPSQSPV